MTRLEDPGPEAITVAGRRVAVYDHSPARAGRVIVFCHPAPGCGSFVPEPRLAATLADVTVIALDRPGYGFSKPMPAGSWATVASAADDIAAVLAARGVEDGSAAGWSAGGRVALALGTWDKALSHLTPPVT